MLIFDTFPEKSKAEAFADAVKRRYHLEVHVCDTEAEARQHDVFPFEVRPPVVMVERQIGTGIEPRIIAMAKAHGGDFAGT